MILGNTTFLFRGLRYHHCTIMGLTLSTLVEEVKIEQSKRLGFNLLNTSMIINSKQNINLA